MRKQTLAEFAERMGAEVKEVSVPMGQQSFVRQVVFDRNGLVGYSVSYEKGERCERTGDQLGDFIPTIPYDDTREKLKRLRSSNVGP